ncbi:MAG: hypothetical protein HY220_02825 [Candidatus Sungbacteria bacterium]|uniref:Uncharacterized protein n=1 Tax=Candidatus Sungiibacteriota bacterium TaxID=2750080 RepID=A0A9D6QVN3_9BACT|nr:hypothetical protein [Candidatus Sungbacteria bacterium]
MLVATKIYSINEIVPVSGNYICVPCGYVQYFEAGDKFIECLACLAGTLYGPAGFQSPADEFWQFVG